MKSIIRSAVMVAVLFPFAGNAKAADVADYVRLKDLAPETSIFLLNTFNFPTDERALQNHARVDYFVDGNRVSREELSPGLSYCAIVSANGAKEFTEKSKQFQIAGIEAPNPAPREGEEGVGIRLSSFQDSTIHSISCFQPQESRLPLTVRTLRQIVRMKDGDVSLSLLTPLTPEPASTLSAQIAPAAYRKPAETKADTIAETHRAYMEALRREREKLLLEPRAGR